MAIINNISGFEGDALNFIIACLEGLNSEADSPDLIKVHVEYMKTFIDTFEQNEIVPVLNRAQNVYKATPRSVDVAALKAQHNTEVQNGTRTEKDIQLPSWPKCFKNPILIQKLFGATPTTKKSRKGISALTDAKLNGKISLANNDSDLLYLVEYFIKFYMVDKESKNYYLHYDKFMDKCKELGYIAKAKNTCFQVKTKGAIAKDIIGIFLYEDMLDKDNKEFLVKCLDRYYELFA